MVRALPVLLLLLSAACGLAEDERDEKNRYIYLTFYDKAFEAYCLDEFDVDGDGRISRYEAQRKLAEDRVYRQSALLEKDAVSQEAYEQARTELAMLNADIDIVKSNIALTELHAPFDGVIGLRNVSEGAYASPDVVVAKLTKISPLKIDFFVPERYACLLYTSPSPRDTR